MDEVLVIGESLIDIVTDEAGHSTEVVGGSPANIAFGLARQRVPVRILTALAHDDRGERIRSRLASAGVTVDDASWSLSTTSTARARILADGSAHYDFDIAWVLPDAPTAGAASLIHVGSIGAFLEPGATLLERWLGGRDPRTHVSLDPNIRPALLSDRVAALARFERIAAMSDVVKLSDEDADWLYPGLGPAQVCERVLALGVRLAALTRGRSGATMVAAKASVEIAAPPVTVQDTVGAGDTFMAALIFGVLTIPELLSSPSTATLADAGAYAAAAASLTVQRRGADLPTRAEILHALSLSAPRAGEG